MYIWKLKISECRFIIMKQIFNTSPYTWILLLILMLSVLVVGGMNVYTNGIISILSIPISLFIGYFLIPRHMNFKLVLELRKDSLYFENGKIEIEKDKIRSIDMDKDNTIEITYLNDLKLISKFIKDEEVHVDINKLYNTLRSNFKTL